MIFYPKVKAKAPYRQKLDKFKGYKHNLRIGSGEFYEMENLTSDDYPVLSVRKKRGFVGYIEAPGYATGMLYVPGTGLFMAVNVQTPQGSDDPEEGELYLLDTEGQVKSIAYHLMPGTKSIALMGKKLIVAPDMVAVDIDTLAREDIEYVLFIKANTAFQICKEDGTDFSPMTVSEVSPNDPQDGEYWLNTTEGRNCLMQYSDTKEVWSTIDSTWVKISSRDLQNHSFQVNETITISGIGMKDGATTDSALYGLNGEHRICSVGQDSIVIKGFVAGSRTMICDEESSIEMIRDVPKLDFVVESGNRLWGCARNTNEIYACALGEFNIWNRFPGLSTDSWVGNVGTPGEFTGAVVQNGYPIFYKENCKHKVWPSSTGAHQITTVTCNGVEKGSENSLAVLDGTVFYKSSSGIFADDGGGAVEIGHNLGDITYSEASGTVHNRKYYLNMYGEDRKYHLFVYDIARKLWHLEDGIAGFIASGSGSLYSISGGEVWDLTGNTGTLEEDVSWMAVTGDLGLELPEQKYISRLTLRLSLDPGASLEVYAQYDREQTWVKLGQVYGTDLRSFSLPVRPRRCDQLRLKLQGTGMCKLYSITKTLEKGSELS